MTVRCGCPDEADDIVFGPMHRCSVDPEPPADLPRFVPSWMFVVPEAIRETTELRQSDFTLSPPEPRYMQTLDESERTGD